MALNDRKTSGQPGPTRRDPETRRKYRPRNQREAEANRLLLVIVGVIAAMIIGILVIALLIDTVIKPAQAVASVGGSNISTADFQNRVIYERWRNGNIVAQYYNDPYGRQQLADSSTGVGQLYSQLTSGVLFGKRVLDQMVEEKVILQYAKDKGITVEDAVVDKKLGEQFGFNPNPLTATPTVTPTITLTPLVSPTPNPTLTATPTGSATPIPTTTPFPTGVPTATPGLAEQQTNFEKTQADVFKNAAKLTGLTETQIRDQFRQSVYMAALLDKVKESVAGPLQPVQDQVKARHILVKTEEEANTIIKALQGGESFAALAQANSIDTGSGAQGGELGWAPKGKYVTEFEDYVWNGKVGEVSGPIKSQYGYHIIQLQGREARPLSDTDQESVQAKKFQDWLDQAKIDKNVATYDVWTDRVPGNPSLADFGVPDNLSTGSSGGLPSGLPIQ